MEIFGKAPYEDNLEELSRLQQTSLVTDYMNRFEALLNGIDDHSKEAIISFFIGRLKQEIRTKLKIDQPISLTKEFTAVKIFESKKGQKYYSKTLLCGPKSEPILKTPLTDMTIVPIIC